MSDPAHPLKGLKVAFVHPDLGIGGAENLVVNAAVALQKKGHEITMYTAHHDKSHCFPETTGDGVLAAGVVVYGDWLPRHIFLRLHVAFAIIRMIYVSIIVVFFGDHDVIFVDQVSHCIPILRLSGKPVLFYCHYPDKLLCTERSSALKRLYRAPVDWLEEKTTEAADKIVVNSKFTASVFKTAFGSIAVEPGILYPPINVDNFVPPSDDLATAQKAKTDIFDWAGKDSVIILSINRFERKKNIALAVQALAQMKNTLPAKEFAQIHLVLAGGYDKQNQENVDHLLELQQARDESKLQEQVHFLPSFSDAEKVVLLQCARCVVYTPDKEHFGIVPIEAMYAGVPVVAVASGGPLETVVDGETGFLCEGVPAAFAAAMTKLVDPKTGAELKRKMGLAGHARVKKTFTLDLFADRLDGMVQALHEGGGHKKRE